MLVGGVAVAAAAPSFPFRVFSFPSEIKIAPTPIAATISEYADYYSFSSFALTEAIDPIVAKVAAELAYRAEQEISEMYVETTTVGKKKRHRVFGNGWNKTWVPELATT